MKLHNCSKIQETYKSQPETRQIDFCPPVWLELAFKINNKINKMNEMDGKKFINFSKSDYQNHPFLPDDTVPLQNIIVSQ